jgi:hypothetical protein
VTTGVTLKAHGPTAPLPFSSRQAAWDDPDTEPKMDIVDESKFHFDVGPDTPLWFIVPAGTRRISSLLSQNASILTHRENEEQWIPLLTDADLAQRFLATVENGKNMSMAQINDARDFEIFLDEAQKRGISRIMFDPLPGCRLRVHSIKEILSAIEICRASNPGSKR